jgi:hypothetical protein
MAFPIAEGSNKYPPETDEQRKARTGLSSLQISDDLAAGVQKTPNRIALADIEAAVDSVQYMYPDNIKTMTICTIRLKNGYGLVGKSAAADPENFDAELGRKFAREDAIRSAWPLFAFALRERMTS